MAKVVSKTDLIADAVSNKNWNRLAEICESYELEAANLEGAASPFYGFHLLAYLLQNDLNNARFLWKRIPSDFKKSHAELGAIWKIGQALWNRNYDQLWPSLAGHNWSAQYVPLIAALGDALRARTFHLLSKSYTSISVDDAAVFLGLTPKDVIAKATSQGWQHDAAANLLMPVAAPEPKVQSTGPEHLKQLTDYVVFLEQQ